MRKKLYDLYNSHLKLLKEPLVSFQDAKLNGPFLLSSNRLYLNQKNKVMIIGQETNGWETSLDIDTQQKCYENFKNSSSPFWNATRKLEKILNNEEYSSIWANINKFDVNEGSPRGKYEKKIGELDFLLLEEIKIISPDICIFFTGPNFDNRIKNIFQDIEFKNTSPDRKLLLDQLIHPNLPQYTFRTYHPNYLRKQKLENTFLEFISSLIIESNNDKHS